MLEMSVRLRKTLAYLYLCRDISSFIVDSYDEPSSNEKGFVPIDSGISQVDHNANEVYEGTNWSFSVSFLAFVTSSAN